MRIVNAVAASCVVGAVLAFVLAWWKLAAGERAQLRALGAGFPFDAFPFLKRAAYILLGRSLAPTFTFWLEDDRPG